MATDPTQPTRPAWHDQPASSVMVRTDGRRLVVRMRKGQWCAQVFGHAVPGRSLTREEAKARALELARIADETNGGVSGT